MEKTIHSQNTGEVCLICEETKHVGIHICDQFICQSCEQKLVKTNTDDEWYVFYLRKLRKLGVHEMAKEN
ncbi:MAG TPA: sigma factor G inhibitor Gin [Bacillales bacterium]|nr:sigma factor G inhibitor Gin [Bacillales bacterium]